MHDIGLEIIHDDLPRKKLIDTKDFLDTLNFQQKKFTKNQEVITEKGDEKWLVQHDKPKPQKCVDNIN